MVQLRRGPLLAVMRPSKWAPQNRLCLQPVLSRRFWVQIPDFHILPERITTRWVIPPTISSSHPGHTKGEQPHQLSHHSCYTRLPRALCSHSHFAFRRQECCNVLETTLEFLDFRSSTVEMFVVLDRCAPLPTSTVWRSVVCHGQLLCPDVFAVMLIRGWVNNYPQCSCICVSVGSTVVFACIARRGFHLITTVQVWSCSVSSFVATVTLTFRNLASYI